MLQLRTAIMTPLAAAILALACSADAELPDDAVGAECPGGKCDALEGDDQPLVTACDDVLFDRSGREFLPTRLAEDPLIALVYQDAEDGCPVTADAIMAVLEKNDPTCTLGNESRIITEEAQLSGESTGARYRAITSRTCGGRSEFELLFSMFGFADRTSTPAALRPEGGGFPGGLEIIAFERESGVFNYYKEVGGKMGFFGSSTDFVTQEPGGPGVTSVRGCGNCHTGGGLIMKELTAPWLHWEGDFTSPGADTLIDSRADVMGVQEDGPNLQFDVIQPGNEAWNDARLQFVNENGTLADLLEPLFCPVEVNIASFDRKNRIGARFLVDRSITRMLDIPTTATNINLDGTDYDAYLGASGSNVPGTDEADVVAPWAFIERSHADADFVERLIDAGIINTGFALDVLMVDFTRPALSNERCDLLRFTPDLDIEDRDPKAITEGFITALEEGAGDDAAANQLLEHLRARVDREPFDHETTVEDFIDVCRDRASNDQFAAVGLDDDDPKMQLLGVNELHIDTLKLRSLHRKTVMRDGVLDQADGSAQHSFPVFEFSATLPTDDVAVSESADPAEPFEVHPQARLSPVDCSLVSEYVAAGAPADPNAAEEDSPCPGACGDFVLDAACQCDADCVEFGNCCEGFEELVSACPGDVGEFVLDAECQCDANCINFGNCCDGFEPLCI